jgi:hypothetical protein
MLCEWQETVHRSWEKSGPTQPQHTKFYNVQTSCRRSRTNQMFKVQEVAKKVEVGVYHVPLKIMANSIQYHPST